MSRARDNPTNRMAAIRRLSAANKLGHLMLGQPRVMVEQPQIVVKLTGKIAVRVGKTQFEIP